MKLFPAMLLSILFSCGTAAIKRTGEGQTIKLKAMNSTATLGKSKENSDSLTIERSVIQGNTLTLEISYTGGCTEHGFELKGSEMISKSLPPIRAVRLIHKSNGDTCKAKVSQTLNFDISELAYKKEPGSEIMLRIEGIPESLKYTYK